MERHGMAVVAAVAYPPPPSSLPEHDVHVPPHDAMPTARCPDAWAVGVRDLFARLAPEYPAFQPRHDSSILATGLLNSSARRCRCHQPTSPVRPVRSGRLTGVAPPATCASLRPGGLPQFRLEQHVLFKGKPLEGELNEVCPGSSICTSCMPLPPGAKRQTATPCRDFYFF